LKLKGAVSIRLFDANGNLKDERHNPNVVVTVGKNFMTTWLAAASQSGEFMSWIGLGTSSTPALASDTALGAELSGGGYSRQQGTLSASTNVWQNQVTFGAGVGTGAVTEAGIFSVVTTGTMLAHQVFTVINIGPADTLQVTWQITVS
jgi:hypothetical protein